MLRHRWLSAAALLLGLALTVRAEDDKPVNLAWKLKKPFVQTVTTKTTSTVKAKDKDTKQNLTVVLTLEWTPDPEKEGTFKEKITALRVKADADGKTIDFDSASKEDKDNPADKLLRPIVGAEYTVTVDPTNMKVTDIKGPDTALKDMVTKDVLKEVAQATFSASPKSPKKGDPATERTSKIAVNGIGTYTTTSKYTFDGTDKDGKMATFKVTSDITFAKAESPAAVTGIKWDKKPTITGTLDFDIDKGRVAKVTKKAEGAEGKVTVAVDGKEQEVTVKLDYDLTSETKDKASGTGGGGSDE